MVTRLAPERAREQSPRNRDEGGAIRQPAVTPKLTLILPIYQEAGVVDQTVDAVLYLAALRRDYCFVFVDDGSDDGTPDILQARVDGTHDEQITLVRCARHRGKGSAIRSALEACGTDMVCFIDGDMAYSLDQVALLEVTLEVHDVVIGSRALAPDGNADRQFPRRAAGWAFNRLVRLILGLPHGDTQAGLKGFRTGVARRLFALQRLDGLGFDAELLFLARKLGLSVAEVAVRVSPTHVYKTALCKLLRNSLRMLLDVLEIRWNDARGRYSAREDAA